VRKDMRTHGREGATEPGQDGPGPVGPGRPAWPTPVSVRPPFLEREDPSTLSTWRHRHSQREGERERTIRLTGRPQEREREREREEEGDHSREGSLYTKEATTSGGGRRGPAKTPLEEKEDTV
jgi:hypothetical protein